MDILLFGSKTGAAIPSSAIKKIEVDKDIGITINAFDPITKIKMGYNNYPQKMKNLKKMFFYAKQNKIFSNIKAIDLNTLNKVVVSQSKRRI